MKSILFLLVVLAFPGPVSGAEERPAVRAIDSVLTAWHQAAATANAKVYFDCLTADAVFIGTDAGERWTRKEFEKWARPYFERGSAWVFAARERHIRLAAGGRLAWFDELLDSKSYWPSRGSGLVVKTAAGWKIAHYVISFTIPNSVTREIQPIVERALVPEKK